MAFTAAELLMNADLFRQAFPDWPGVRAVTEMTAKGLDPAIAATLPARITRTQSYAIRIMHGDLGRACPELIDLSFTEAGDLIIELRAEVLALNEGTD